MSYQERMQNARSTGSLSRGSPVGPSEAPRSWARPLRMEQGHPRCPLLTTVAPILLPPTPGLPAAQGGEQGTQSHKGWHLRHSDSDHLILE